MHSSAPRAEKDYLTLHLRELPYFRSLVRAVEARFYQTLPLPAPTLDIGCGDGHFASVTFDRPLEAGIDPWLAPLREAQKRCAYRLLLQADGASLPFPDRFFASAVSNSVLEHILRVDEVLLEINRVLQEGAPFYFCVPNHQFLASLSLGKFFDRVGLHPLGDVYRAFFNRISRHYHCDPPEVWQGRLERSGFELLEWWHYFPPSALAVVEWGHYFGLPSLIVKWLSGRWILIPTAWNLSLPKWIVKRHYQAHPRTPKGVYTFYVARKSATR
ncbi:MAG: class I SAM-dependent methyltransferase [Anaerolineales bacterium]|nr:class I SAM-dependent methyltransferase [Anaerolineales bacterium]MDW8447745.1 class I SAM-dependent methyltransferase [Anaerolineales bacterium]